jgi:hypothetical protein
MSTDNPCCHDCTDFPETETPDAGCCTPIPVRRDCERPVVPVPACDEEAATIEYDEDTEEFFALGKLYDSNCSSLTDSTGSILTALVG